MPKNWCWVRHKVLFDFVGGSQPPKEKFIFTPKSNYVRLYQIRDYGDKPDPTYIPSEFATKISKKGEILLARYGGSLGKVFFAENGAYNVALAKIVILDNNSILSKYAYYFYCSPLYQTFIAHVSARSAQGGFNSDEIGELLFPLPPLAEQQRIVDKLEELEPYISEYERLVEENEQLDKEFPEKLKQSILQYAMQGKLVKQDPNDEPASVLLERIKQEKEKLIREGKVKKGKNESIIYRGDDKNYYEKIGNKVTDITDEIPFEIPDSWCFTRLHNIAKIRNGFTPLRSVKEYWTNGEIPWFTIEDKNVQGPFINYTMQHISSKACTKDRIVPPNSILVCCTASIGEVAYTNINLTTNQQFNALTIYQSTTYYIEPMYLYYFCLTLKTMLIGLSTTTTFGFVSVDKLGHIILPIPTLKNQRTLIGKLKRVIDILDA